MKPKSMKTTILVALLAPSALFAQTTATTTPVGYVTNTLAANQYNLLGLTLHSPTVSSGVITAESASSVSVAGVDFTSLLTAGATYILELSDGTIQEITSWTATTLNTPQDVSSIITPATTTYKLRKAATVSDIFGSNNSVGLAPDTDGVLSSSTDFVLILNQTNSFDVVYYFNDGAGTEGWFDDQGADASTKPIVYADSFYVQRGSGAPINFVVSGEVKTTPTKSVLASGFNFLSAVSPVGLTLGSSGLEAFISGSTDGVVESTDNVLLQVPGGAFAVYYYFNDGAGTTGWFDDQGASADTQSLTGGFLVLNRGGSKSVTLSTPTFYSSL